MASVEFRNGRHILHGHCGIAQRDTHITWPTWIFMTGDAYYMACVEFHNGRRILHGECGWSLIVEDAYYMASVELDDERRILLGQCGV